MNKKSQAEKYDIISAQHGGYYRYRFIDHAYLYNLHFPPEEVFTHLKAQIHNLVLNYPVAQNELAILVGDIINQPPERIIVGNGAAELIKIVSGHVAQKLIIPVPSFNEYVNAAPDGHVIEFPLDFPSFTLDVEKFAEKAISNNADVAVVVTPNNPTSMLVPKADLIWLAEKLQPHNCILIIDESFLDFAEDPEGTSLENELDQYPNMVIFKSMSKSYGICGLRLGYMLSANKTFNDKVRDGIHIWNINGFAEEFLRILPNYLPAFKESCKQVRTDRDILYQKLCEIEGMVVYKPDANYVFCRLPKTAPSAPNVKRRLFIGYNIYIKDCVGKSQPDSNRYIRVASRTKFENTRLVDAIKNVINQK